MTQLYQNAMAISRYFGKPTLFIAFTANPRWREIQDEVAKYLNGRYISPIEAAHRLFEFPMHEESPAVTHLATHLKMEYSVCFDASWSREKIGQVMADSRSTLMGYFEYNNANRNKPDVVPLLYQEFPEHMVWNKKKRAWTPRQNSMLSIARMHYCNPSVDERYYLRLLLTVIRGSTSYADLRTVSGVVYSTLREACMALHLIEDGQGWIRAFEEAAIFASGYSLRSMFISVLLFDSLVSPIDIWTRFCRSTCDDLEHAIIQNGYAILLELNPSAEFYMESRSFDYGLHLLQTFLSSQDKSVCQLNLSIPLFNWNGLISRMTGIQRNSLILSEMSHILSQELGQDAVDFQNPAFIQGHSYVALSRASSANGVSILLSLS
ncbi:hypothetical protein G6F42_014150 [Rhizopus arrhizus]|nr:hypothetical protein G6F42_014150 [Rhizopus arrhizus]